VDCEGEPRYDPLIGTSDHGSRNLSGMRSGARMTRRLHHRTRAGAHSALIAADADLHRPSSIMAPRPPTPSDSMSALSAFALERTTLTPTIGTAFPASVQLSALLSASDSDALVADLAALISARGVVFFAAQDLELTDQHALMVRLGANGRRPPTSTLHKHPVSESTSELAKTTSVISSMGGISRAGLVPNTRASSGWHADITFERVPSDYAVGASYPFASCTSN
jgi:hypothetical protein